MDTAPLTQIQRAALLRLVEAVTVTSRREAEVVAARDDALKAAEARIEAARRSVGQRHDSVLRAAEREAREESERVEREAAERLASLEREWREAREEIEQRAVRRREGAEQARREAIWLAETVFEAHSSQPQELLDQTNKGLAGFAEDLDQTEAAALRWVRSCRQTPAAAPNAVLEDEATPADRAAAEAAGTLASKRWLDQRVDEASQRLAAMRQLFLPRLFRSGLPLLLVLAPAALAGAGVAWRQEWRLDGAVFTAAGVAAAVAVLLLAVAYIVARAQLHSRHRPLLEALASGRRALARCADEAVARRDAQLAQLVARRDRDVRHAEQVHGPVIAHIEEWRQRKLAEIEARYPREIAETSGNRDRRLAEIAARRDAVLADVDQRQTAELKGAEAEFASTVEQARRRFERDWSDLVETWRRDVTEAWADLERVSAIVAERFPGWNDEAGLARWREWAPAKDLPGAIPFGQLAIDLASLEGGLPKAPELALPGPAQFTIPALLPFPEQASLLAEAEGAGLQAIVPAVQAVMFRLLTSAPPGKVRFTIVDPVGLGQNFAGFMHLADDDGALVTDRIWTEDRHIEQRLLDMTEHMENVIQKYLRNEYQSIGQYNVDAGEIAEPYRFLVVANLPVNFSESAARRLMSIASSGPRCGVFTLLTADTRAPRPPGLQMDELARASTDLSWVDPRASSQAAGRGGAGASAPRTAPADDGAPGLAPRGDGRFAWNDPVFGRWPLTLDTAPPEELLTRVLKVVGSEARLASRVEVPFAMVAPPGPAGGEAWWSGSTTSELRVPMGRAGATKLQELGLGVGVAQHVLIAGKTGSGKSTLLHALITNLAMWYSPDEVEFYLVDFKKGVEFKTYAANDLPHARAVAIESDREFGLSVLQRLDAELRRRGELYRARGVQDLAGYRRAVAAEDGQAGPPLPRTLLVIDEFQEFFTEDDKIAQDATLLLDRLVRQGRAFGIHVILGSQTLGGAYSLARATIGQMAVRIALQCSESDSYLILSDDNAAARLLSRPGEAIYNDAGGLIEGNSPFQIAWLDDAQRDRYLEQVRALAERRGAVRREPMIVFEGNVPAELERNPRLAEALEGEPAARVAAPQAWLGEAIAIKDPTAAVFRRQSGANLLIVGQRDEAAVAMLFCATLGLLAQRPDARVHLFDALPADAPDAGRLEALAQLFPGSVRSVAWRETPEAIAEAHAELERRRSEAGPDAAPVFLVFAGLQRYRMLRQEDDFGFSAGGDDEAPKPDRLFGALLREGPLFGVHTLAWVDTVNNLGRTLDRQSMKEFEQRVLFQMGQADSSHLIDSPVASKLGLHRAIYFSEESGALEKFRPYAIPDAEWLKAVAARIRGAAPADARR